MKRTHSLVCELVMLSVSVSLHGLSLSRNRKKTLDTPTHPGFLLPIILFFFLSFQVGIYGQGKTTVEFGEHEVPEIVVDRPSRPDHEGRDDRDGGGGEGSRNNDQRSKSNSSQKSSETIESTEDLIAKAKVYIKNTLKKMGLKQSAKLILKKAVPKSFYLINTKVAFFVDIMWPSEISRHQVLIDFNKLLSIYDTLSAPDKNELEFFWEKTINGDRLAARKLNEKLNKLYSTEKRHRTTRTLNCYHHSTIPPPIDNLPLGMTKR